MRFALPTVIVGAVAVACGACDKSPLPGPSLPFTLSGVVTEYHGGPLSDVMVLARPARPLRLAPGDPRIKTTLTDAAGFYRIDGLTEATGIEAVKDGYGPTGYGAVSVDTVINLTMTRRLQIAAGEALRATIWGDSVLNGEDDTGAHCDTPKPCVMIPVTTNSRGTLTARLKWSGPENELGVFISTGFYDGQGAYGPSPLAASLEVPGGVTLVVVSFEKSGGARPAPHASQAFELETAFVAR